MVALGTWLGFNTAKRCCPSLLRLTTKSSPECGDSWMGRVRQGQACDESRDEGVGGKSICRDGRLIGWPIMSLEFLRIPNFKKPSTSCQLEPSPASNTDVGSPLLRQSDRDPVLKLRKACPRCWRGLACARRAHSAAQEMASSIFPRCVRTQLRFELRCFWRDPDKNSLPGPNCIRITTSAHSLCAGSTF